MKRLLIALFAGGFVSLAVHVSDAEAQVVRRGFVPQYYSPYHHGGHYYAPQWGYGRGGFGGVQPGWGMQRGWGGRGGVQPGWGGWGMGQGGWGMGQPGIQIGRGGVRFF